MYPGEGPEVAIYINCIKNESVDNLSVRGFK